MWGVWLEAFTSMAKTAFPSRVIQATENMPASRKQSHVDTDLRNYLPWSSQSKFCPNMLIKVIYSMSTSVKYKNLIRLE